MTATFIYNGLSKTWATLKLPDLPRVIEGVQAFLDAALCACPSPSPGPQTP